MGEYEPTRREKRAAASGRRPARNSFAVSIAAFVVTLLVVSVTVVLVIADAL